MWRVFEVEGIGRPGEVADLRAPEMTRARSEGCASLIDRTIGHRQFAAESQRAYNFWVGEWIQGWKVERVKGKFNVRSARMGYD